jgi:hypothetical protein
MPFSVRLTDQEEALLEAAARRTSRTKSELVREGVRELCLRLAAYTPALEFSWARTTRPAADRAARASPPR